MLVNKIVKELSRSLDRPEVAALLIDQLLVEVERLISAQVSIILHHPSFQALEGIWRATKLVIDRLSPNTNIRIEILNCSFDDLLGDFEDSPEVSKSGLYKLTYSAEYSSYGGRPYAVIAANYEFNTTPSSMLVLERCGAVASAAHAVFMGGCSSAMIDARIPNQVMSVGYNNQGLADARWHRFRAAPDSHYVALAHQKILARAPRANELVKEPNELLWVSAVYAALVLIGRSFEMLRIGCHIEGPIWGRLNRLPSWESRCLQRSPDMPVTEIAAAGVMAFVEVDGGALQLAAAPTCMSATSPFWDGLEASHRALNCTLPAVLYSGRFAQLCKVVQRRDPHSWFYPDHDRRKQLETVLQKLLAKFVGTPVLDDKDAPSIIHAGADETAWIVYSDWLKEQGGKREILSGFLLHVEEQPGEWRYRFELWLRPRGGVGELYTKGILEKEI